MFGFFKRKPKSDNNPISEVGEHLRIMGYDLTDYGAAVALLEVESGYSVVETAAHIALTTMALDSKSADFERSILIHSHAMALIQVLKEYRDKKMMRDSMLQNDARAVFHVATIDGQQREWIDKVLSDPIAGKERLANSRITYARPSP
jgi:hypothetical protein